MHALNISVCGGEGEGDQSSHKWFSYFYLNRVPRSIFEVFTFFMKMRVVRNLTIFTLSTMLLSSLHKHHFCGHMLKAKNTIVY